MTSEWDKMRAGDWYCCMDPEIDARRTKIFDAVHRHNMALPSERGDIHPDLRALLGAAPETARIEGQFHLLYGENLFLGEGSFLNVGCVVLDSARVEIGENTMIGPRKSTAPITTAIRCCAGNSLNAPCPSPLAQMSG